jgi:hypothetical protein
MEGTVEETDSGIHHGNAARMWAPRSLLSTRLIERVRRPCQRKVEQAHAFVKLHISGVGGPNLSVETLRSPNVKMGADEPSFYSTERWESYVRVQKGRTGPVIELHIPGVGGPNLIT